MQKKAYLERKENRGRILKTLYYNYKGLNNYAYVSLDVHETKENTKNHPKESIENSRKHQKKFRKSSRERILST